MRVRMPGAWLMAGWLSLSIGGSRAEEGAADTGSVARSVGELEAVMAAPLLVEENEQLRGRVAQLDGQVAELTVLLAETRAVLDRLQVQRDQLPEISGLAGQDVSGEQTLSVLEVNRDLALVVLNGGVMAGMKPGLVLAILRDERVVARVRAIDVRKAISGARIETVLGNEYPQQGDRVIVWRSSM